MRLPAAILVVSAGLSLVPPAAAGSGPDAGVARSATAPADLARLTLREMILQESQPLARRGYVFRTTWLDGYFRRQPWYRPTGFDVRALPADEQERRAAIARFRAALPKADLWRRRDALWSRKGAARRLCPYWVAAGGTRLLVQDGGGLLIWDVATAKNIRVAPDTRALIEDPTPAISRDGTRVLAVEAEGDFGRKISSWDTATGKPLGKPLLQTWDMSTIFVLTPDGTSAFVHKLSDPRSGELRVLDGKQAPIPVPVDKLIVAANRVAPSADGRRVLALAAGRPWLWQSKAGAAAVPVPLPEQYDQILDGDLSPDGRWAAVIWSSSAAVKLMDLGQPGKPKYLESTLGSLGFVSFSPDGRLVMAGTPAHELAIWEVPGGRLVFSRKESGRSLDCARRWAAFLPGGDEVATVDDGGGVTVLGIRTRAERALNAAGQVADREADDIEEALLHRALGHSLSGHALDPIPFHDQPDVFNQPLEEDDLGQHVKRGGDLRELEALIYARRGRRFESPRWRAFAEELAWYHADAKYDPGRLTAVDRANLALIVKTERTIEPRSPRGPPDKAALVPRSAFPGCPPGTKQGHWTDDRGVETINCGKTTAGKLLHGPVWTWLPTGSLRETRAFANGKEHGPKVTWYWTGVRQEEGEMANGQRNGRWRSYHPDGKLADESTFAAGKRQGPRRRFFENGKPALEAVYERGAPAGPWTAYYDNGQRAVAVSFPPSAATPIAGSYPDGKPWPAAAKIQTCEKLLTCTSPLARMDIDSLPPVLPEPACAAGKVPRAAWKPIVGAARIEWADAIDYRPGGCTEQIRISCAPDLDGAAGPEVLAEIDYRILINGQQSCHTKEGNDVWEMTALVVMSPPAAGRPGWTSHGLVGYPRFQADNGGTETSVIGFVRLPSGELALHTSEYSDPGDCGPGTDEGIVVLRDRKWVHVASRTTRACSQPDEPEAWDVF